MLEAPLSRLEAGPGLSEYEVERILFARQAIDNIRGYCPEVSQLPLVVLGGGGDLETWMGFGPQLPGTLIQFSAQDFFRDVGLDDAIPSNDIQALFEAAKLTARHTPAKSFHDAQGCYTATPRVRPALQMLSFLHRYGINVDEIQYCQVDPGTHRLAYSGDSGQFALTYIQGKVEDHAHYQRLLKSHLERTQDYSFAIRACEGSFNLALDIMQHAYGRSVPKVIMTDDPRGYHEYWTRTQREFGNPLDAAIEKVLFFPQHRVYECTNSYVHWGYSYHKMAQKPPRIIAGVRK